jgi:hypothetical protein
MSLVLAFAEPRGYYPRPATVVGPQWPRLTVVGIEAAPVRRAA